MTPYPSLPSSHNGLKAFEAAARLMSFTLAADELNVTQSAISRQIKQLEDELNASLVIRKHRAIELTVQGHDLYVALRESYGNIEAVIASWSEPKQKRIVIKATLSFATRVLISKVRELNERYQEYEIVIVPVIEEDESINSSEYDLLIFHTRFKKRYDKAPDITFLREEFMAPVCSTSLTTKDTDLDSILTLPRLHPTLDHHDWKVWLADVESPPKKPVRNTSFLSLDMALSACLSGEGVTVTDLLLVQQDLQRGFLYCPKNAKIQHSAWTYFIHQRSHTPIINDLIEWLREETEKEIELLKALSHQNHWFGVISDQQ
ncbi:LysR family transcriptional regulator, glycine cleavage system transcriptional activator [Vibrio crassostreae]|uniref:LysR family transcriptional regulator n=1 Tax=Vibrio crassostreae TaxID=246167 RepID=UPI000F4A8AB6|nr:LysR family transcriptional regulator [Vibrio crassostreae]ROR27794.1 LysR family glycine cleavage system transcriptional activator [Vibrio crassostreae]CAK1825603.1 LysR family transcriptional regulator, glycine cleavage system transcriptional activator [Vibrio crassostreae]CAK1958979.1 LysR family transcriptional regulator, glycine cleavage system transcriptional activator [Vibrio crassostreae]CAK1965171.1 LysR family transcriptional regulator, glycine cleavage system transcriptional activ